MSNNEIGTDKIRINNIPALVCYKKEIKNAPLIIFSHGFTGNKKDFSEEMKIYAKNNFYTVSIDNKAHGERNDIQFFEYAMENEKLNILKVRELINETAKEIHEVINFFEHNDHIDIRHTAMLGVSMGGFITFRALTLEKRISTAALFISSPVWDEFPKNVPLIEYENVAHEVTTDMKTKALEWIITMKRKQSES
jgi:predicted esterase